MRMKFNGITKNVLGFGYSSDDGESGNNFAKLRVTRKVSRIAFK